MSSSEESESEYSIKRPTYNLQSDDEEEESLFKLYDSSSKKRKLSSRKVREERRRRRKEKEKLKLRKKKQSESVWKSIYVVQLVSAIVVVLATAIALYLINPPLTQKKRKDPYTNEKQDWKKVLFVLFIVFVLVFLLPVLVRLFLKLRNSSLSSHHKKRK